MAVKHLIKRKTVKRKPGLTNVTRLRSLIEDHRTLGDRMAKLLEQLEDEEDNRIIEEAKRRNGNKPLIPWEEAKKRLGLNFD